MNRNTIKVLCHPSTINEYNLAAENGDKMCHIDGATNAYDTVLSTVTNVNGVIGNCHNQCFVVFISDAPLLWKNKTIEK